MISIKMLANLKGLEVRAPTRQTNKFLSALGATPVATPVPQVGEAMAKGVIEWRRLRLGRPTAGRGATDERRGWLLVTIPAHLASVTRSGVSG